MTSVRDPKRSFSNKRIPDYIKEIRQNWLKEPPKNISRISIGESKMVYRMTLGSLYYDMGIKKVEAKESETDIGRQIAIFLKTKHPGLWRKWVIIKNETNSHLDYTAKLWKDYILGPVDKLLFELKSKYQTLAEYRNMQGKKDEFYVEQNIKEGVYLEIQHYAALGYRLDLFRLQSDRNEVGNGYTFIRSSNRQLLEDFIDSISRIISNEKVLSQFRSADVKKSEVEAKVFEFRKDLIDFKW
jgi:hypothetical protein